VDWSCIISLRCCYAVLHCVDVCMVSGLTVPGRPLEGAQGSSGRVTRAKAREQGGLKFTQVRAECSREGREGSNSGFGLCWRWFPIRQTIGLGSGGQGIGTCPRHLHVSGGGKGIHYAWRRTHPCLPLDVGCLSSHVIVPGLRAADLSPPSSPPLSIV